MSEINATPKRAEPVRSAEPAPDRPPLKAVRLAEALRANLARRKAQRRARAEAAPGDAGRGDPGAGAQE